MNAIQTTNNLDFQVAEWHPSTSAEALSQYLGVVLKDDDQYPEIKWQLFRVGTCDGQWRETPQAYEILSVANDDPGNGHLNDVLEWFEFACKKSKKPLRIIRFSDRSFMAHLIKKRGFKAISDEDVEKGWREMI